MRAAANALMLAMEPPEVMIPVKPWGSRNISRSQSRTWISSCAMLAPPSQLPTNRLVLAASHSPTAPAKLPGPGMYAKNRGWFTKVARGSRSSK